MTELEKSETPPTTPSRTAAGERPDGAVVRLPSDPLELPILRMIIGDGRSGTTALLRAFANHPDVFALYQPIKAGHRTTGGFDYRIYTRHPVFDEHPGKVYVVKELVSYMEVDRRVPIFPSDEQIPRVRPLFLIRHPIADWASTKKLVFDRLANALEQFLCDYLRLYELHAHCLAVAPDAIQTVTFERLVAEPQSVLQRICENWGLSFCDAMLHWSHPLEHNLHLDDSVRAIVQQDPRWMSTVHRTTGFIQPPVDEEIVTREERATIQRLLVPAYEAMSCFVRRDFPRGATPAVTGPHVPGQK